MLKAWMGIWLMLSTWCMASTAVDVVSVHFDQKRLPGLSHAWTEAAVRLRPNGPTAAEHIQLKLWLEYKQPTGSCVLVGSVRLYSLADPAVVRFYVPAEVLRARRLGQAPSGYFLEVSSSAGAEAFQPSHASPLLAQAGARAQLKTQPSLPLLPHYATPFYSLSDTYPDLPAYVVP